MDQSPNMPRSYRIGGLRGYLPLSAENAATTRGQRLPGLIQNRSAASLIDLGGQVQQRRPSSLYRSNNDSQDVEWAANGNSDYPDGRSTLGGGERRMSAGVLMTPQMRSMRLIGNSNPRYRWEKYYKDEKELKKMTKPLRQYYEHNNHLIAQYLYIDRLLDSSLPHNLIQEYSQPKKSDVNVDVPQTIREDHSESTTSSSDNAHPLPGSKDVPAPNGYGTKVKRTPKAMYRVPDEETHLLGEEEEDAKRIRLEMGEDDDVDSGSKIVTVAIYINLTANAILLAGKIAVIILTSSLSVLASLVDAALDFLSTAIVWTTTKLISRPNQGSYPVGRQRLEPIGVLVFSVVMITSFFQVCLECFNRLTSGDPSIVRLGLPAIIIMAGTVVIKFGCWLWCRLINNSSVQALAQDAMTDVVFNIFSIIFPLVGYYAKVWWLDALGGLLLSLYVIFNWSRTSSQHIRQLTGFAAPASDRALLLYLTMRFAQPIKQIQNLQAYHAGDKLNVEVDIVLDEKMTLRDSHDIGESLQYVLESVPRVERAFVHMDYDSRNLPSHMAQRD